MRARAKALRALAAAPLWYAALAVFAEQAHACSVCFGAPDDPMTKGMNFGILVLLGVTGVVLGVFALFFLKLRAKAKEAAESSAGASSLVEDR